MEGLWFLMQSPHNASHAVAHSLAPLEKRRWPRCWLSVAGACVGLPKSGGLRMRLPSERYASCLTFPRRPKNRGLSGISDLGAIARHGCFFAKEHHGAPRSSWWPRSGGTLGRGWTRIAHSQELSISTLVCTGGTRRSWPDTLA